MEYHDRKSIRIPHYDYSQNGAYFITICTQDRKRILSRIVGTGANATISKFITTFKRFCNKEYGENIWQGRYYDHVVRNQQDYNEIWTYIENNPRKWMFTNPK